MAGSSEVHGGRLVICATPIGNLADASERLIESLRAADSIACEDTRRTGKLLEHLGIERGVDESRKTLISVNSLNEGERAQAVVERVAAGEVVALVSDAGTPVLSDPGALVVAAAIAAEVDIEVIPGPFAGAVALVASGLGADRFVFEGFLPRSGRARTERLEEIAAEKRTTVLYEAPQRLERTLTDLEQVCGSTRNLSISREMTKLFEETWRGDIGDSLSWVRSNAPTGEFVIVLEGAPPSIVTDKDIVAALDRLNETETLSTRDLVDCVATDLAVSRSRVYRLAHADR